jgi:hypothetical protein
MLSNKVCLIAALVGTLCPTSDGARAHEDLDVESAACHCACAGSVSSAMFTNRQNLVYGTAIYTGKHKPTDILYYVEVRHLTQGFGDTSFSMSRKCDYEYCNKDDAGALCPPSKPDADGDATVQFLQANRAKILAEARTKLTGAGTPRHGWGIREIREGQQPPAILDTDDPEVVVAVYWTALSSTRRTPIDERMVGWPFEPQGTQLAWGFEEVLDNLEKLQVKAVPDMTEMPRGILVTQELHAQLPSSK